MKTNAYFFETVYSFFLTCIFHQSFVILSARAKLVTSKKIYSKNRPFNNEKNLFQKITSYPKTFVFGITGVVAGTGLILYLCLIKPDSKESHPEEIRPEEDLPSPEKLVGDNLYFRYDYQDDYSRSEHSDIYFDKITSSLKNNYYPNIGLEGVDVKNKKNAEDVKLKTMETRQAFEIYDNEKAIKLYLDGNLANIGPNLQAYPPERCMLLIHFIEDSYVISKYLIDLKNNAQTLYLNIINELCNNKKVNFYDLANQQLIFFKKINTDCFNKEYECFYKKFKSFNFYIYARLYYLYKDSIS